MVQTVEGPSAEEKALWARVNGSNDLGQFELYLSLYPQGEYVASATTQRNRARQEAEANALAAAQAQQAQSEAAAQQLAAVTPAAPAASASAGDHVNIKYFIETSTPGGSCNPITSKEGVKVPLGDSEGRVASSAGRDATVLLTATRMGSGAVLRLDFAEDGVLSLPRPIEIELDSLAPGSTFVEYTNVNYGCGNATVYVDVVD